jgi:hypothetical protein
MKMDCLGGSPFFLNSSLAKAGAKQCFSRQPITCYRFGVFRTSPSPNFFAIGKVVSDTRTHFTWTYLRNLVIIAIIPNLNRVKKQQPQRCGESPLIYHQYVKQPSQSCEEKNEVEGWHELTLAYRGSLDTLSQALNHKPCT